MPEDNKIENEAEISFGAFIVSLATQAMMQLGEIKPPQGVDLKIDKLAAKQTIEVIAMLEKKTSANLDAEEKHLISDVLHNLRLSYIKAV